MAKADNKSGENSADDQNADQNDGQGKDEFVAVEVDGGDGQAVVEDGKSNDQTAVEESNTDDDPEELGEDDESDDDEHVGHDAAHEGESNDERKARRKRERRANRIRKRQESLLKDRHIEGLTRAVQGLSEQVQTLRGRTVQYDESLLRTQLAEVDNQLAVARDTMAKCVKAQDGEGVAEVTDIQYALRDRKRNLELLLERTRRARQESEQGGGTEARAQRGGRAESEPAVDPRIIKQAAQWAGKHNWYDPKGG